MTSPHDVARAEVRVKAAEIAGTIHDAVAFALGHPLGVEAENELFNGIIDALLAWHEARVREARRAALEEAMRLVCNHCDLATRKEAPLATLVVTEWWHQYGPLVQEWAPCRADAIRARAKEA